MTTEIKLGKLSHVSYGHDGDGRFGMSFTIAGAGWGVQDSWSEWTTRSKTAWYSEEEYTKGCMDNRTKTHELLTAAKVKDVSELVGVPVEVTFNGNMMKSWRVLEEVL